MKPRAPEGPYACLARLMAEIGQNAAGDPQQGIAAAARFEGMAESVLYKQLDPDQPGELPWSRICRLTQQFGAAAAAEHLAGLAGGVFLPMPRDDTPSRWADLTANAGEDFARAMADIVRALSPTGDGAAAVTQAEARRILEDIEQVLRVVVELRGLAFLHANGVAPE